MTRPEITIFNDRYSLFASAADRFIDIGVRAIRERSRFIVALSGGSTPESLYSLLATEAYRNRIAWERVVFLFGDERNVQSDDERSNFRLANRTLFGPLAIPPGNIHRWMTELADPAETADRYDRLLSDLTGPIDLCLLGIGEDGHTASLFPDTAAINECDRLAVSNWVPQLGEIRFTMTFPAINASSEILFVVSGASKAKAVMKAIAGPPDAITCPASGVRPISGSLTWLLDEEAGSLVSGR